MMARDMHRVVGLLHCTSTQWEYMPMKFQVSSVNTYLVIRQTKFKYENQQTTQTQMYDA